ncbi:MAG TPA: fumarylacetoacetate hydrolase family protein, partial [Pirellulaceae bacterium]
MNHFEPDSTHDPERKSWVESSRDPASEFPLQNLPWCVFREPDQERQFVGVGIGDRILNVRLAAELSCFAMLGDHSLNDSEVRALKADDLGQVMSLSSASRRRLRRALFELLSQDCGALRDFESMWDAILVRQTDVELVLPTRIGDYTDFYASIHHATHVGMMLRPENPLLPNYKWIPVGYHGRGSSIVVSGTPIRRPAGQVAPANDGGAPTFKPCGNLDYELEMGIWIASGNTLGQPIPMAEAEDHFFGVSLLNDWSARDIQKWEYQPLGPFLAKNFATSISPWIVTREALT